MTNAPSPPIITNPIRAGTATASAVRMSGEDRCSVFWMENAVPKPPGPCFHPLASKSGFCQPSAGFSKV